MLIPDDRRAELVVAAVYDVTLADAGRVRQEPVQQWRIVAKNHNVQMTAAVNDCVTSHVIGRRTRVSLNKRIQQRF